MNFEIKPSFKKSIKSLPGPLIGLAKELTVYLINTLKFQMGRSMENYQLPINIQQLSGNNWCINRRVSIKHIIKRIDNLDEINSAKEIQGDLIISINFSWDANLIEILLAEYLPIYEIIPRKFEKSENYLIDNEIKGRESQVFEEWEDSSKLMNYITKLLQEVVSENNYMVLSEVNSEKMRIILFDFKNTLHFNTQNTSIKINPFNDKLDLQIISAYYENKLKFTETHSGIVYPEPTNEGCQKNSDDGDKSRGCYLVNVKIAKDTLPHCITIDLSRTDSHEKAL